MTISGLKPVGVTYRVNKVVLYTHTTGSKITLPNTD